MNDDIEILDIFDDNKRKQVRKVEEKRNGNADKRNIKEVAPKRKKKRLKVKALQLAFCGISALFILGCLIFYGSRFIKYYRIYNPKVDDSDGSILLAKDIEGKSEIVYEGSGLYISSGNYIYKGKVNNNYLEFNNMLWRIVRINSDNSIEIILDDYINILPWNDKIESFANSEIYDYLNNTFLNGLDKDLLAKTSFCEDILEDFSSKCTKQNVDSYVKLLDLTSFLNSVKDKKSYLVNNDEIFWLADYNTDKIWHTNGTNASQSGSTTFYEIRPVVKLKNTVTYIDGNGTKDNPYIVGKENKIKLGSTIMLGNDKWIVYSIDNDIKLMRYNVLDKKNSFDKENLNYNDSSLKEYLNTTYLDSLSYKDKLVSSEWYIGSYTSKISDVKNKTTKSYVGIPNILDIKFNSKINSYFMSTAHEEIIWVYENPLRPSRSTSERSIRPCIAISKEYANSLSYIDGVFKEA